MPDTLRVAGVQMDTTIFEKERNLRRMIEMIEEAAMEGSELIVFPEACLTGYCFDSLDEIASVAEPLPTSSTEKLIEVSRRLGVHVVYGTVEAHGTQFFNALAFVGPDGLIGTYRKIHLPYLAMDRFMTPGDRPFATYATRAGRIGINICYDVGFPESARVMALQGAEVIVLPTNWPVGLERNPQYLVNARALENQLNYVAVNRCGGERGYQFIGRSKIADYRGETVAEAGTGEEIIYADLNLAAAREKQVVSIPGGHPTNRLADRRPEFYGLIAEPNQIAIRRAS